MRTVLFHQGALGDFLLAVGAFEGVCAARPDAVIDFWSKPEHVSLLSGREYLGGFHSLEDPVIPALLNDGTWENARIPDFLWRADEVVFLAQGGARLLADRLSVRLPSTKVFWARSFPAPEQTGPGECQSSDPPLMVTPNPPDNATAKPEPVDRKGQVHVTRFVAEQLVRLGLPYRETFHCRPLIPPLSDLSAAKSFLQERGITSPPVFVHPGSGGRKKIWPLSQWRNFLHWIISDVRLPLLISLGPADSCLDGFAREMERAGSVIVSGLSLTGLAALISLCRFYIGSDSGVSHLAAATGTSSVVIFGPTDPEVWAPRGPRVRVIRKSWNEREVLEGGTSDPLGPPDPELMEVVVEMLA